MNIHSFIIIYMHTKNVKEGLCYFFAKINAMRNFANSSIRFNLFQQKTDSSAKLFTGLRLMPLDWRAGYIPWSCEASTLAAVMLQYSA
ncbi:MAG: hypothetical protein Pg6C_04170 [Treponemataceae bacterium]|nr:MAG: hypothetical protein Pg6C_04170 [Treponemataceae bacterium]